MSEYFTTTGGSATTFTLSGVAGARPASPPSGLVSTRAVQTKSGWLGQVWLDGEIIWESDLKSGGYHSDAEAQRAANKYVVDRFRALLAPPEKPGLVVDSPDNGG